LTDIEGPRHPQKRQSLRKICAMPLVRPATAQQSFRHQRVGGNFMGPDYPESAFFDKTGNARQQVAVTAAKHSQYTGKQTQRVEIRP
jgi:hypothetical protein